MKFTDYSLPALLARGDEYRGMDHVRLRLQGDVPVLDATDGRSLTIIPLVLEDGEEYPLGDAEILLDASDLRAAFRAGGKTAERRLLHDASGWRVDVLKRGGDVLSLPVRSQDSGTFPSVSSVIEGMERGREPREIHLNADYLRDVLAALGDAQNSNGVTLVTLRIREAHAPFEILRREGANGEPEARALVMPITLDV